MVFILQFDFAYLSTLFLEPEWALSASWAIDQEAIRAWGIIVLVKSNWLLKNIATKQLELAKRDSAAIVVFFKAGAFRY